MRKRFIIKVVSLLPILFVILRYFAHQEKYIDGTAILDMSIESAPTSLSRHEQHITSHLMQPEHKEYRIKLNENVSGLMDQNTYAKQSRENWKIAVNVSQYPEQHVIDIDYSTGYFITPSPPDWFGTIEHKTYLYVYSAYYIDASPFRNRSVVLIGLISRNINDLNCILHDHNGNTYSTYGKLMVQRRMVITFNTFVFVLWCTIPEKVLHLPTHISIQQPYVKKTPTTVPVQIPKRPSSNEKTKPTFLICLKSMYVPYNGTLGPGAVKSFIEWVEMNRLLGVDHITVYVERTTRDMQRLLSYYSSTGYIDLVSKQPDPVRPGTQSEKPRQHLSLNDCMYRHHDAYDWLLMIDADELIVPTYALVDLSTFITYLSEHVNNITKTFLFENAVFFTDHPANLNRTGLSYLDVTLHKAPEKDDRRKYLVASRHCLYALTHYCKHQLPRGNGGWVEPDVGQVQHYKACAQCRQNYTCQTNTTGMMMGDRLLSYEAPFVSAVQDVITCLQDRYGQGFGQ